VNGLPIKCPSCKKAVAMICPQCQSNLTVVNKNIGTCPRCHFTGVGVCPMCRQQVVSSACFIATAAYGTPMTKEIEVLRSWRDQALITNKSGRTFVKIYYKISPQIANHIRDSETRRRVVRILLAPIVKHLKKRMYTD